MADPQPRSSLFSQKLDRRAFGAYLVGAAVPLCALAVVVQRFVLPELRDQLEVVGLVGTVLSIAVLSLASFLALRATTQRSLAELDHHNQRLASLLKVAGSLSRAEHAGITALSASSCAVELTTAAAAWVIQRGEPGQPPHVLDSAGQDAAKLHEALRERLEELANLVMSEGRPGVQAPGVAETGDGALGFCAAAAPL